MSDITDVAVEDVEKRRLPSKHYVYMMVVTRSDGSVNVIYRRYSKFFELQCRILDRFPVEAGKYDPTERILPFLPGKILIGRSHVRAVALKRLQPIDSYCKELMKIRNVLNCPEVQQFFSVTEEDLNPLDSAEKLKEIKSDEFVGKEISGPVLNEQYVVIASYNKDGPQEVSLFVGELVDVIEKYENGWWFVSGEDGQGWAPSSYLERPDGQTEDTTTAVNDPDGEPFICMKNYEPKFDDEVKLTQGAPVSVMKKDLNGWWLVRSGNTTGKAPATFLAKTDTVRAKNLKTVTDKYAKDGHNISQPQRPEKPKQRLTPVGFDSASPSHSPLHSPQARHRVGQVHSNHNLPVNDSARPFIDVTDIQGVKFKFKIGNKKNREKRKDQNGHRQAAKEAKPLPPLPGPGVNLMPNKSDDSEDECKDYVNVRPPPRQRSLKRQICTMLPEKQSEPIYMCTSEFLGQAPGTMNISHGQQVKVIDKSTSGWSYVESNNEEGWVPTDIIMRKNPLTKKLSPARPPPPKSPNPSPKPSPQPSRSEPQRHAPAVPLSKNVSNKPPASGMNNELMHKLNARKTSESNPRPYTSSDQRHGVNVPRPQQAQKPIVLVSGPTNFKKNFPVKSDARWSGPLGHQSHSNHAESDDSDAEYANDDEVHEARTTMFKNASASNNASNFPRPSAESARPKPVLPGKKPALPNKPTSQSDSRPGRQATGGTRGVLAMKNMFEKP